MLKLLKGLKIMSMFFSTNLIVALCRAPNKASY